MTVGREPGDSTMIRIAIETKDQLNAMKIHEREAIGDVVKRVIQENKGLKAENAALLFQIKNLQTIINPPMPSAEKPI